MYEDYMQNFFSYPVNGYRDTYEQEKYNNCYENYPYENNNYGNNNMLGYNYIQNRNVMDVSELEACYPEIYNIVYPMVRKACMKNNRGYSKDIINSMVEEIYSNLEGNDAVELNITLNNDVRGESQKSNEESKEKEDFDVENRKVALENRQIRRNPGLNDLIRILLIRELLRNPNCIGPNCRPGPGPRPPMPPRPPVGPGVRPRYF